MPMKYMLGTNICIYVIKHRPPEAISNFLKHDPEDMCISSITYGELMHGVEKSQAVERNRAAVTLFLSSVSVLSFDDRAAEEYGKVRADLERKGTPIGPMDMLIAGHARSEGLTLVTNNTREFLRVENLAVEDWTKE
jgi:tRNA(fMet)-specific endonuclease VapC